jgi:hypothetical protein
MTGRWRALVLETVLGTALVLAGCGVPAEGEPRVIPPSEVPYGLADPRPSPSATPVPEPVLDPSRIYLLAADDRLVARARETGSATLRDRLTELLGALADGPTPAERDEQLSTALPPGVGLAVSDLSAGTATIDIDVSAEPPSGWASRRAVAQIVLTATSLPEVDAVRLTISGDRVEAPLPSGELTSEPLTAADVEAFLTAAPSPSDVPAPPSAAPPS